MVCEFFFRRAQIAAEGTKRRTVQFWTDPERDRRRLVYLLLSSRVLDILSLCPQVVLLWRHKVVLTIAPK